MNLILAAQTVINHPDVKVRVPSGLKDALAPVLTSRPLLMVAILFGLMAIGAAKSMPKLLRIGAIVFVVMAVAGWLDTSGVALAAAGGKQENVNTGVLTGAVVGGGYLLMKVIPGMRKKPSGPSDAGVTAALKALTGNAPATRGRRGRRRR